MRILCVLTLLVLLGACGRDKPVREYQFFALGTLVHLTIFDTPAAQAERARVIASERLQYFHRTWHAWQPGPLMTINRALASGEPATVPAAMQPLIKSAQTYARKSNQLFNPAIGKLIALWGFHSDDYSNATPPDAAAIAKLVQLHPSMEDLIWNDNALTSQNRALQLDFGALAKGFAIERIVSKLKRRGIDNLILNAGGDLKVLGSHGSRPWRIAIRDPRGNGVYALIEARDGEAIFTSGDYQRYFEFDGKRYHHLIDPRTGYPADGARSVTVIANNGAQADVASTALFIAGTENWPEVAKQLGVNLVLMIDANGNARMTPAMEARIEFEPGVNPEVIIQQP